MVALAAGRIPIRFRARLLVSTGAVTISPEEEETRRRQAMRLNPKPCTAIQASLCAPTVTAVLTSEIRSRRRQQMLGNG